VCVEGRCRRELLCKAAIPWSSWQKSPRLKLPKMVNAAHVGQAPKGEKLEWSSLIKHHRDGY
jgi:hypothetical protein